VCARGIEEWLTGLINLRAQAGDQSRRGRSWFSGEVLPGPSAWKASRATSKANRRAGTAWKRLEWGGHGARGSGGDGGRWRSLLDAKSGELRLGQDLRACGEVWPRPGAAL
jgi:hypothetical protein